MEYVRFDNEELNQFLIEATGKDEYILEDIIKAFTSEEIRTKERDDVFYKLELAEYELGISKNPPQKQKNYKVGENNIRQFEKIIDKIEDSEISLNDFLLLQHIGERDAEIRLSGLYKLQGIGSVRIEDENALYIKEIDFSETNEDTLLELSSKTHLGRVRISSFRGMTTEKLKALGDITYEVEGDLGNPYSIAEIEQLLLLMESMKSQTEGLEDIDKFLSAYKNIGMHVDYDMGGCSGSEEYTVEKSNETRSLRGVLLNGKAVCIGYAEALKYVCDYIGLEAEQLDGTVYDENGEELGGHAWNQVKIDEEWYNTDLTWDYKHIRRREELNCCLKCDEEFNKGRKKDESIHCWHICNKNYDQEEIAKRLAELPYTDLDKVLFDATEGQSFQEPEMQEMVVSVIALNPNFSQTTVQALKKEQQEQQQDGTDR